jgi:hypothetical protein
MLIDTDHNSYTKPTLIDTDHNGYAEPISIYRRLLTASTSTRELEQLFFPQEMRSIKEGKNIKCRLKASVSFHGTTWQQSDLPCSVTFRSFDHYRKHILSKHLGCRRQGNKTQRQLLGELCTLVLVMSKLIFVNRGANGRSHKTRKKEARAGTGSAR